mgnify:CR=1 FL=1
MSNPAANRLYQILQRWGPALVLMLAIFLFSNTPSTEIPNLGGWDRLVKKGGHMLGYALLALTLLVLLVASINFQLNLGYLLTFLLAGSAVAGMHVCHATLRGLSLHLKTPAPHFAGDSAALEVQLSSERTTARMAIALAVQGSGQWAWTDVPAQGTAGPLYTSPSPRDS